MIVSRTFHHGIPYTFSVDEKKIVQSENAHRKKFLEYAQNLLEMKLPNGFSHPPRASGMRFPLLHSSDTFSCYVYSRAGIIH